jgi:hypothetical protein
MFTTRRTAWEIDFSGPLSTRNPSPHGSAACKALQEGLEQTETECGQAGRMNSFPSYSLNEWLTD